VPALCQSAACTNVYTSTNSTPLPQLSYVCTVYLQVSLTSKLARKKQQERAMERIALPTPTVGLPDGVTQRDDVYVKTAAFLTQHPELD
jgi:hypothetical protein